MKLNKSLFTVKEKIEVKSGTLVDTLHLTYEKNYKIIAQILFSSSVNQKGFKYPQESSVNLVLSSKYNVPDICLKTYFLSSFTVDVEMYPKENEVDNIRYFYYAKFRLFLDAKILEVKEAGFFSSSFKKIKESEKEGIKQSRSNKDKSVQDKLTKSLLVNEWFNKLVELEYTLNKP